MNSTQRRLHSYRHGRPAPVVAAPRLARGATVTSRDGRTVISVAGPGFEAEVSMPRNPRGWIVVAEGEAIELEADAYAVVRVAPGTARALVAARQWLVSLPETRGLPIAIAGGREGLSAAAALGPALDALVLEPDTDGPPALVPTLLLGHDEQEIDDFLDAQLRGTQAPALNHRQRRLLARGLIRAMRGEVRGLRAAVATLASALALTLSLGGLASPASAAVTASHNSGTGQVSITGDGAADSVTVGCQVDGISGDDFFYDTGGGPQTLPGPVVMIDAQLECRQVLSMTVDGGGGADALDLSAVDDATDHFEQLDAGEVTIAGGGGNDTIDGSDMGASLQGGGVDDVIDGGPGDDTLVGNTGNDDLAGLGGTDAIDYSASVTSISGSLGGTMTGEGTDTIAGELLIGTTLGDSLTATAASTLLAGSGADTLTGSAGVDSLSGEAGADSVSAGGGADTVRGGSENDTLAGGATGDSLFGDAGTDSLDGGTGGDFQFGGTENDTLVGGDTGNDSLNGEAGNDMAQYSAAAGAVTINLQTDSATGAGTDTLTSIEGATGSAQGDSITGDTVTAQGNTLIGGNGVDTLTGQQGADTIAGEGAADTIFGGGNADTLDGGAGNDTLDPSSSPAGELLSGGTENDVLLEPDQASTLSGNDGQDTITGSGAADTIDAGAGPDTVEGNSGADTIGGAGGSDTLFGDNENDSIFGGTESDFLDGRSGNDTVTGDGGDDTVLGNTGADSLDGGEATEVLGDEVRQVGGTNPTLTDSQLTGDGPDALAANSFERASLSGGDGLIDAAAFTGSVTLDGDGGDTFRGASGNDSIVAGSATDRIEQTADANQTASDTLLTGDGNDTIGVSRVALTGGPGNNSLDASTWTGPAVTLDGQGGDDTLTPGSSNGANDSVVGGAGTLDRLVVSRDIGMTLTDTQFTGSFGDVDTLSGLERASLAGGTSGNDLDASAFGGAVTLSGGDNGDTLAGGAGADSLIGGNFGDRLEQTSDAASQVLSDTLLTAGAVSDTLSSLENVVLTGGGGANAFNTSAFTLSGVIVDGQGGNDTVTASATEDDSFNGAGGTDRIAQTADAQQMLTDTQLTTAAGLNTDTLAAVEQAALSGGASDNPINASAFSGAVTLLGLAGNDFLVGAAGSDSIDGGTQTTIDTTTQAVNANQTLTDTQLTGVGADTIAGLEAASLFGGAGPNDLDASGFSGRVELFGDAGDDTLAGAAGNDTLEGVGGTDRVEQVADANQTLDNNDLTGDGNDFLDQIEQASITGGAGGNDIDASAFTLGPTTLSGLGGGDTLDGTPSADRLLPGTGSDSVEGAGGIDRLEDAQNADLGLTPNSLTAGAENDTLDGQIETASLSGGAGANQITAAAFGAPVTLDGLGGADTLVGSSVADSLLGGTENDALQGRGGIDSIDGGGGANTADYSDDPGGAAIQANLNTGAVTGAQTETLASIQNVAGTSFGDTLTGSGAANTLIGNGGPDQLTGGDAPDALFGNAGADTHNSQDGGTADTNDCGADTDTANADVQDTTTDCETVNNPAAGQPGGPPAPTPPTPPPTLPGDTKAPDLDLSGKAKQKDKTQIKVTATVDEAATVEAGGTIKIPEIKRGKVALAKSKKFDLKGTTASLAAGQTQTLKLKLSGQAKKLLKKAIKTKTSTAKVNATATDAAGNAATSPTLKVKVKK